MYVGLREAEDEEERLIAAVDHGQHLEKSH